MAGKSVLALVTLLLLRLPQPVLNGLDEDLQMSAEELEQATPEPNDPGLDEDLQPSTEEMEQATPEPNDPGWTPLIAAALQQGPFWAAAELLLLSLGLWIRRRREAMRQRAAAWQAEKEARRRRMEIEQRRLRFKRAFKERKEMLRTMKMMERGIARLVQMNMSR